jgi:hypothetical protein
MQGLIVGIIKANPWLCPMGRTTLVQAAMCPKAFTDVNLILHRVRHSAELSRSLCTIHHIYAFVDVVDVGENEKEEAQVVADRGSR